ncbi:MAG: aspartyl/glutamyl-tRNA amidotransferase subunit A [Spirochaetaceae bacterium]|jgi:aspartyl-tRNA(Asn)/glutamyl-tRNA(Gln) amidotransferase subunit A|nr:aspartyl/glutamyl-tRNA amidotransferase subunit A [Spirochaetaceae bacterium]
MSTTEDFSAYFARMEEKTGAFIEVDAAALKKAADALDKAGKMNGAGTSAQSLCALPFAVKDNIAVEGMSLSCGSKLLSPVRAPYTAAAVSKLLEAGAFPLGKTNMDEFGMGSSTDASALKKTNNPWDESRVAGGSSGGSAAAVAAGLVPFALGSDTGGSVRQPAAFCGVVGLKPTYGAVSRFGLVAYASSLDTVGILAGNTALCKSVFDVIKGKDERDQTTEGSVRYPLPAKKTLAVLAPQALEKETAAGFEKAKERFSALGYTLIEVDIPALKYAAPAYYTIATAEASANLARFDGVRYGKRSSFAENSDELVDKAREEGFGAEVKLRILLGTFVLRSGFQDRYYHRAQRIRAAIRESFEKILGSRKPEAANQNVEAAAILMPVFPCRAFGRGGGGLSAFEQKAADLYTCCANLAGLPALSFQASVEGGLPVGVQLMGRAFDEETLFALAADYEAAHPFRHPAEYKDWWK